MDISELISNLLTAFPPLVNLQASSVVGVSRSDDGWVVSIEMIEKKSIPDSMDILGCYEVKLDDGGRIRDFSRVKLRRRGDTVEE